MVVAMKRYLGIALAVLVVSSMVGYRLAARSGRDDGAMREILTVHWCNEHRPRSDGMDDRRTTLGRDGLSALPEAEAETNRLWCELLHRTLNDAGRAPRPRRRSSAANRRAAEGK